MFTAVRPIHQNQVRKLYDPPQRRDVARHLSEVKAAAQPHGGNYSGSPLLDNRVENHHSFRLPILLRSLVCAKSVFLEKQDSQMIIHREKNFLEKQKCRCLLTRAKSTAITNSIPKACRGLPPFMALRPASATVRIMVALPTVLCSHINDLQRSNIRAGDFTNQQ
jgi:hypothetical protein